jgi:hypothetical protein
LKIPKIFQFFFSIPSHNAETERTFSLIQMQWTKELSSLNTESDKRPSACAVYLQSSLMQGILCLPQEQSATSDEDKIYRETFMSTTKVGA